MKRTISLPGHLVRVVEQRAARENTSFSAVIQTALREMRRSRLDADLREMQDYWSHKAKEKGILSERDLMRYLAS